MRKPTLGITIALALAGAACGGTPAPDESVTSSDEALRRGALVLSNDKGFATTIAVLPDGTRGTIDLSPKNAFFHSFGSNGRTCGSCHVPSSGWTITPADVQFRFLVTGGRDPIFRTVDGSNSPTADVSSPRKRFEAYSMLLRKGLIRIGMPVPANAEFELAAVDDPYGYASASELSLFRRPLPTTNLKFLSAVMWDGRETMKGAPILSDLLHQANTATLTHAQAVADLSPEQENEIVAFESSLYTAQTFDFAGADSLTGQGAQGGPQAVADQLFYLGINDTLGADPRGLPFSPVVFTIYDAWNNLPGHGHVRDARAAVARGQAIFNSRTFAITGVKGLNDALGIPSITGTCTTCHNAPNAGDHSVALPLDIGLTDAARRTADMPLYTLRNKATGALLQTTDPGRAMVTGKWNDIARFKGPILRALPTRAPYFHNGFAANLGEVVNFYNTRFSIGLSSDERADLEAFLQTL